MNTRSRIVIAVALLILPFVARSIWFYRGTYSPPVIPNIEEALPTLGAPEYRPFVDQPVEGNSRIVFDISHANNLNVDDLTPLQDRLAARGASLAIFDKPDEDVLDELLLTPIDVLKTELRSATAWVVAAPTTQYTNEERDALINFVEDGGRLLLVADPTHSAPPEAVDEFFDFGATLAPTSAIPAINSLANAFDVIFFEDYLYNLVDNEGNYRNVKFTDFGDAQPLSHELDMVVFFATHSLRSGGVTLVGSDKNTFSSLRAGETGLSAAALTADGHVLTLGDLTVLTAPYHTVADNDQLLSNIADWLATDTRDWGLDDFPYLFRSAVDLVQLSNGSLDTRLIAHSNQLQEVIAKANIPFRLRAEANADHNTLFVGTFDNVELVQEYLTTAGITITISADTGSEPVGDATPEPMEESESTDTEEGESTDTEEGESTDTESDEETTSEDAEPDVDLSATDDTNELDNAITIQGVGTLGLKGSTLFIVDNSSDNVVVIVLAEDGDAAIDALQQLASGDFSGCFGADDVTVCTTGELQEGLGFDANRDTSGDEESNDTAIDTEGETPAGEESENEVDTPPIAGGRIFILENDGGPDGKRTGVAELESILGEFYDLTIWSVSKDGLPDFEDLEGYDGLIIDSGDYAADPDDFSIIFTLAFVESPVILLGAQPLPFLGVDIETEPLNDIEVVDTSHPLAAGFSEGEVIVLSESESGVPAFLLPEDDTSPAGVSYSQIVFARGPDSPSAGSPVAVVTGNGDELVPSIAIAAFEFYRLPEDVQRKFALNIAKWMTES